MLKIQLIASLLFVGASPAVAQQAASNNVPRADYISTMDVEFRKMDGGLSCLSLRSRRRVCTHIRAQKLRRSQWPADRWDSRAQTPAIAGTVGGAGPSARGALSRHPELMLALRRRFA